MRDPAEMVHARLVSERLGDVLPPAAMKCRRTESDGWVRRKLRRVWLKPCKRVKPIVDVFVRQGVSMRQ
ncbi:Mobile element protein [Frigoriglobus tundricola]|uniref:Mobile element protein n=1 Tax=Frigoriglobus tundricola TaxID=2774151 RepID=A0A6M5YT33_9BACT|nr:Mobile element protein [Frigoriglobus tundricola]